MSNGGINLAALGFGGIDTSSIVTSLVAIQQQPINQLNTQSQNISSASATVSSFSTALSALKTAATALDSPSSFLSTSATSSSSAVVASVSGQAPPGQWTVAVSSIAQEQRTLSNGTPSSTTALGLSGNLGITLGSGATASIPISATDTLADITGHIASAGLRVQASMVYDGSQYHLLVTGLDTGSANTISFDESGLSGGTGGYSLGLSNPGITHQIQAAQNANLTIGGIPVSSATNQITNAIPGVTLAVTQPTAAGTPATVSIASDPTSVQQNLQNFVNAYNAVVTAGHTDAGFGTTQASNPLLQANTAIRSSLDDLGALMGEQVAGTSGAYTTLSSAGIALNDDGTLTLDTTKLSAALQADPTSVERLFVTDPTTGATGIMDTLASTIDSLNSNPGNAIQAQIDQFTSRTTQITNETTAMQTRLIAYQTQLQNEFTQMNTALAQYKQMATALNNGSTSSSSSSNGVL